MDGVAWSSHPIFQATMLTYSTVLSTAGDSQSSLKKDFPGFIYFPAVGPTGDCGGFQAGRAGGVAAGGGAAEKEL